MTRKIAIFEACDQDALLQACESDNEFVPIWLMMRCGMHPSDVSDAKDKITINGQFIEYKRAKNAKSRRELVPENILPRLVKWLKVGRRLTREGYFYLVARVGNRVDHPEYSPMTLRHTFCIQQLREYADNPDPIRLVSIKMGCSEDIVAQNYLDLNQWEKTHRR